MDSSYVYKLNERLNDDSKLVFKLQKNGFFFSRT